MIKWVLKTPEEMGLPGFAELYAAARAAFPGIAIGAGVMSNFTELNIDRPNLEGADYVTHGTCGVIHEPDDRSVMETLETLPHIFRSVRAIAGQASLSPRPQRHGHALQPLWQDDRRQSRQCPHRLRPSGPAPARPVRRRFASAMWPGRRRPAIERVCFGAPTGPFGLVYRKTDYPQPWFDAQEFAGPAAAPVYPLYHPLMAIAAARDAEVLPVRSSDEKRALGLCYRRGTASRYCGSPI